jgi:hypothetical protein
MSGSGGSGGGGGDVGYELSCDQLKFEAQLTSPQPAVVASLKVGDVLDIDVANMKGQVIVQVLKGKQAAGGLAGPDATRLRNCMEQGNKYKATVRSVNGGQVRVVVEHI